MAWVNIRHHPLTDIHAGAVGPDWLARARVVNAHSRRLETNRVILVLADEKKFKARPVGIEITDVKRIAVSPASRVKPLAVVIHRHGLIDDLVFAITIHVCHRKRVTAHAGERRRVSTGRAADPRIENPALRQFAAPPIPRRKDSAAINAAAHHHAGAHAIEIGDAGEEAVTAISVTIVPTVSADAAPTVNGITAGNVIHRFQRRACAPVEDGKKLWTFEDAAQQTRPVLLVAPVHVLVANDFALAVLRAVGGLAGDFRAPVAVEIIDHELRVVFAFPDVDPEINSPEMRAIEFVSIEHGRTRDAGERIVPPTRGLVQNDFVFAITIEIAHRRIAGAIIGERLNRNFQITLFPNAGGRGGFKFFASQHRANEICQRLIGRGVLINEVRDIGDRLTVDAGWRLCVGDTVEIKGNVAGVRSEKPPADEHVSVVLAQGDNAAGKVFHLPLCR